MLKTTQAAVVSGVPLRDVNRVIDEGILPEGLVTCDDGRYILSAACMLMTFYFEAAFALTPEERLFAIGVTIYPIAALVAAGTPVEEILSDYPSLDAETVAIAAIYAEAYLARGRPRSRRELPSGAVIISPRA